MIDFEKAFDDFVGNSKQSSVVSEIYDIIPSLSSNQLRVLHQVVFYAQKYDLPELYEFVANYKNDMKHNKSLGFMGTMNVKQLLKAYTMEEMFKGYSASSVQKQDK